MKRAHRRALTLAHCFALALPANAQTPLAPTGAIEGEVRDALDRPVPLATITANDELGRRVGGGKSDGSGFFRIAALPLDREHIEVCAHAPGHAAGRVRALVRPFFPPLVVRVHLRPAATLRGRVLDGDGGPVPGAEVVAFHEWGVDPLPVHATADARGAFVLSDVPLGRVVVRAAAQGFLLHETRLVVREAAEVVLAMARGVGSVFTVHCLGGECGRLSAEALAVETTNVRVAGPLPLGVLRRADELSWEVAGLPAPETLNVLVRDEALPWSVHLEPSAARLAALPLAEIRGQLVTGADTPLVGVHVRLFWPAQGRTGALVTTGAGGKFRAMVPAGQHVTVVLFSAGWVLEERNQLGHISDLTYFVADARPLVLHAQPAVPICGRVVDQDGKPMAATLVDLQPSGGWRPAWTTTASDGTFTLARNCMADETPCVLRAGIDPANDEAARVHFVAKDAAKGEFTLRVRRTVCEGTVHHRDGTPAAGVVLRLSFSAARQGMFGAPVDSVDVVCDRDGRFRREVAAGKPLRVLRLDGADRRKDSDGTTVDGVELVVAGDRARLAVRLPN